PSRFREHAMERRTAGYMLVAPPDFQKGLFGREGIPDRRDKADQEQSHPRSVNAVTRGSNRADSHRAGHFQDKEPDPPRTVLREPTQPNRCLEKQEPSRRGRDPVA